MSSSRGLLGGSSVEGFRSGVLGRETARASTESGPGQRLDPEQFLREQRIKHTHVQIHQIGPAGARSYVVIGYDQQWNEIERTRLTEDGRILVAQEPENDQ